MKKLSLLLIMSLFFLAACSSSPQGIEMKMGDVKEVPAQEAVSQNTVEIKGFAYAPQVITVKEGTTVTWTNQDTVKHTVTSDSGSELSSSLFGKGETYSHTFTEAGTYAYHCTPHPNMKATVIVE